MPPLAASSRAPVSHAIPFSQLSTIVLDVYDVRPTLTLAHVASSFFLNLFIVILKAPH